MLDQKVRSEPWPSHSQRMDDCERRAIWRVMERGDLSGFAATIKGNRGGIENQLLEIEAADFFGVKYVVAMNSATSGLIAAVGALLMPKGTEVTVTPYSMSASVACLLPWGLKPRFEDISLDTFMIPQSEITIHVDLFGNLPGKIYSPMIEDAAQAPGASCNGVYAGTFGLMGVLSLNKFKPFGCGEGGLVLTHSEKYAQRLRLIRNHAEVIIQEYEAEVAWIEPEERERLYGFNFRLPELSAAIAREQLKKLPELIRERQDQADYLTSRLTGADSLILPTIPPGVKSAWYRYALRCPDRGRRDRMVAALLENRIWAKGGYVRPIHRQPIYGKQPHLPNVEQAEREMILLACFGPGVERADLDDVATIVTETR